MFNKCKRNVATTFLFLIFIIFDSLAMDFDEVTAYTGFIQTLINTSYIPNKGLTCVLGNDEISANIVAQNSKAVNLSKHPEKYTLCKAIYIAADKEKNLKLESVKFNRNKILTIGAFSSFADSGGMVQIQMGRRNFELVVNSELMKKSGIKLSPLATELVINWIFMKDNTKKKAIDMEFLRSIIENDIEFEKELFAIFVENAHRNVLKMEEAIRTNDNNSWYMAAHAFKGASASIGAFDLSKILEYAQKHPEDNNDNKLELIKKIKDELSVVIEFINEELSDK